MTFFKDSETARKIILAFSIYILAFNAFLTGGVIALSADSSVRNEKSIEEIKNRLSKPSNEKSELSELSDKIHLQSIEQNQSRNNGDSFTFVFLFFVLLFYPAAIYFSTKKEKFLKRGNSVAIIISGFLVLAGVLQIWIAILQFANGPLSWTMFMFPLIKLTVGLLGIIQFVLLLIEPEIKKSNPV